MIFEFLFSCFIPDFGVEKFRYHKKTTFFLENLPIFFDVTKGQLISE